MSRQPLTPLALAALLSALSLSTSMPAGAAQGAQPPTQSQPQTAEPNPFIEMEKVNSEHGNMGYHILTEDELKLELDEQGTKLFDSLDSQGKKLALFVASTRCQQSNACKGLAACATADHACAGKNQCKATSKCGLSDKNLAVKLAAERIMALKRAGLIK